MKEQLELIIDSEKLYYHCCSCDQHQLYYDKEYTLYVTTLKRKDKGDFVKGTEQIKFSSGYCLNCLKELKIRNGV